MVLERYHIATLDQEITEVMKWKSLIFWQVSTFQRVLRGKFNDVALFFFFPIQ